MRVVCINGSRRTNGNTARALSILEEELSAFAAQRSVPLQIDRISLGSCRIEACRGCRSCFDRGEETCPLREDELRDVARRVMSCDALILASPVYVGDVSGALKTLIDRLAYVCHRPALTRTVAFALATTGGSPCGHALHTVTGALLSWGACYVGRLGITTGALQATQELSRRHRGAIRKAAERVIGSVLGKRPERPSFISLMMFAIQQKAWGRVPPERLDFQYWKNRGFLDRGRTFFIPHRSNPVVVAAARMAGRVLADVFAG